MPLSEQAAIKTGEIYWCEPDPNDTVGSEIEKDRMWVIVSASRFHRGKCVVGVPLTSNLDKACAHLIQIPPKELILDGKTPAATSVALTDQIRSLDKTRFRRKAGHITTFGLHSIHLGMQRLFDM
jgi:mRNA-degrading endonuclease toxin of MazEF toxin-antitoxin module